MVNYERTYNISQNGGNSYLVNQKEKTKGISQQVQTSLLI